METLQTTFWRLMLTTSVTAILSATLEASASPINSTCNDSNLLVANWHDMLNDDAEYMTLLKDSTVTFDASALSLTLGATVEYIGRSMDGNHDRTANLGTTYWLDLQSFGGVNGALDRAGNCANRRPEEYETLSPEESWTFVTDPFHLDTVDRADRTAYPLSDWTLLAVDCHTVRYERTFSWAELTACSDSNGDSLVTVDEFADAIHLRGTFFVELVSPYSSTSTGFYRTVPLVQRDFVVEINRQIDVVEGLPLFSAAVTGFSPASDGGYTMRVLTTSHDFLSLDSGVVVSSPVAVAEIEEDTSQCLVESSAICNQMFSITVPLDVDSLDCNTTTLPSDSAVDFGSTLQIAFTPKCRVGPSESDCSRYEPDLEESGKVVLDVSSAFLDQTMGCDADLFEVAVEDEFAFYRDDRFTDRMEDRVLSAVKGRDIFAEIHVHLRSEHTDLEHDLVNVMVDSVYVCTQHHVSDLESTLNGRDGVGGCLSPFIETLDTVIGRGADDDYRGTSDYEVPLSNVTRFSFEIPNSSEDSVSVHAQLLLTLQSKADDSMQQMLIRHCMRSLQLVEWSESTSSEGTVVDNAKALAVSIAVVSLVTVLVCTFCMLMRGRRRRKDGKTYSSPSTLPVHHQQVASLSVTISSGHHSKESVVVADTPSTRTTERA